MARHERAHRAQRGPRAHAKGWLSVRRRLTLLVGATTVLVLIAFLVPLALLVRQVAADRAISRANDQVRAVVPLVGISTADELKLSVEGLSPLAGVYLPNQPVVGAPVPATNAVRLAALRNESF